MKFLDYSGLQRFLNKLKAIIPTKTSDIQNDSGYLNTQGVQNYMENGGGYSQSYIDTALSGKADSSHTHTKSEITDFPTLATVATSGSYNDLSNAPTIPTVNNKTLTIQKNGTTVNTFTANSASDVTANITVPTAVSELTNDSGYLTSASSLDSSKLTGTIDIARLPKGALERLVTVANQTARFALTVSDVQLGDTVKQLDTGVMYIVTDESKLSSADGYTEYTAGSATSVPWSGVTGKPSSYTPSSHTHGNVTNDGKLPTASRALISDSSKKITVSSVTDTELGYVSGVTSAIQTQLNGKAASNHVHGSITNDGKLGTASRALITDSSKKIAVSTVTATELGYVSGVTSAIQTQLNGKSASNHVHGNITNDGKVGTTANLPLITGTGGVVQAGSFGNAANTFCEGNDSRLSDARTPVAHTHLTADVTDLLSDTHTWTSQQSYNSDLNLNYASTDVDDIVNSVAGSATLDNFVHMTGNETVNGIKSFPDGVIANVTGSATSATNDGSGNVISNTYGKLGATNEWTGENRFVPSNLSVNTGYTLGTLPQTEDAQTILRGNAQDGNFNALVSTYQSATGDTGLRITVRNRYTTGQLTPSGTAKNSHFCFFESLNGTGYFRWDGYIGNSIYPLTDSTYNLGTSSNMWSDIWVANTNTKYLGLNTTLKTKGVAPSGSGRNNTSIAFRDTNYNLLGKIEHNCYSSGDSFLEFSVENNYTNGALDPNGSNVSNSLQLYLGRTGDRSFFPSYNNEVYLGASNKQWKSVFAQTYYYNGTQWGLDQANVWSGSNTYSGTVNIYNSDNTQTTPELSLRNSKTEILSTGNTAGSQGIYFADKNGRTITYVGGMVQSNSCSLRFRTFTKDESNKTIESAVQIASFVNGSKWLAPSEDNAIDLGGSVYRWKSFNGLNPGALSLPDTLGISGTENVNYFNVIGYLNNTGTPATIPSTATYDGWLYINAKDGTDSYITVDDNPSSFGTSVYGNNGLGSQSVGLLCLICPIRAGHSYSVRIKSDGIVNARIYPAQGNV